MAESSEPPAKRLKLSHDGWLKLLQDVEGLDEERKEAAADALSQYTGDAAKLARDDLFFLLQFCIVDKAKRAAIAVVLHQGLEAQSQSPTSALLFQHGNFSFYPHPCSLSRSTRNLPPIGLVDYLTYWV